MRAVFRARARAKATAKTKPASKSKAPAKAGGAPIASAVFRVFSTPLEPLLAAGWQRRPCEVGEGWCAVKDITIGKHRFFVLGTPAAREAHVFWNGPLAWMRVGRLTAGRGGIVKELRASPPMPTEGFVAAKRLVNGALETVATIVADTSGATVTRRDFM